MKQLPNNWKYTASLPQPSVLQATEFPAYLLKLFEKAFIEGYEQAQADMREALGIRDPKDM